MATATAPRPPSIRITLPPLHEHQYRLLQQRKRFNVWVCHRRFGKTFLGVCMLLADALRNTRQSPRYGYIAPLYRQAKDIAWDMLKTLTLQIPGSYALENELAVYVRGRRIRLYGADNPDSIRGTYFDGVVLDEYAQMKPSTWTSVVRPMLADRQGSATFIGTPQGENHFYELYQQAQDDIFEEWSTALFRASDTGVLAPHELASLRQNMPAEEYDRELECSWLAAIPGAYFAEEFRRIDDEQRIGNVPYNPHIPVQTAWDLGREDENAIWFFQEENGYINFIDYLEGNNIALCPDPRNPDVPSWIRAVRRMPYNYDHAQASPPLSRDKHEIHYGPHDLEQHEYSSNKTRKALAAECGFRFTVLPQCKSLTDDIEVSRLLLRRSRFHAVKCKEGIRALRNYQRKWDEEHQVFLNHPLHNWASHGASAFRYAAIGLRGPLQPTDVQPPGNSFQYWREQQRRAKLGLPMRSYKVGG